MMASSWRCHWSAKMDDTAITAGFILRVFSSIFLTLLLTVTAVGWRVGLGLTVFVLAISVGTRLLCTYYIIGDKG